MCCRAEEGVKHAIFKRSFEISLHENEKNGIAVEVRMSDVLHDMTITLDVSLPDFLISNTSLKVEKAPGESCEELCTRMAELNGRQVKHGFTQLVQDLYGQADGCPNLVNMLLSSVPLAINASWMIAMKHGVPYEQIKRVQESQMKDICISFRSPGEKQ